jgi:hypothetical protein
MLLPQSGAVGIHPGPCISLTCEAAPSLGQQPVPCRRVERRQLWQRWLRECRSAVLDKAAGVLQRYGEAQAALQVEYDRCTLEALQQSRVVGMTTSGVAMLQRVVAALRPKVTRPAGGCLVRSCSKDA